MNNKKTRSQKAKRESKVPYTILITEDDEGLARLIEKALQRAGFSTARASNGVESIAWMADHPDPLLLLDYRLPDMMGEQVVETLAQQGRKVPFVMITGHGDEKIAVEMMKLGARDYVMKEEGFLDLLPSVVERVVGELTTEKELADTQQAVRETEEQYRTLIELSPDAVTSSDLEGRITAVNQRALSLYGCEKPEELIGSNGFDLIAPEDRERALENARKVLEIGRIENVEYTLLRKDGSTYPAELNTSLVRDSEGNPKGLISTVRDITDRKRSEEKVRMMLDNVVIGVSMISPQMEILWLNKTLKDWFPDIDVAERPLCYQSFYAPPKEKICHYCPTVKAFETGKLHTAETGVCADGRIYNVIATAVKDREGEIAYVVETVEDITDRRQAEEALKESEQKYRFLVDNSQELILILDQKGKILFANNKAVSVSGYPKEQIIGQSILKVLHKDSVPKALHALEQEFLGRPQPIMEVKIVTGSGEIRDLEIAEGSTPIYEGGELTGILINGRDVTEQKLAEEASRQAEEAVRASQEYAQNLIDSSLDMIIAVDTRRRITEFNKAAEETFGYLREEVMGKHVNILYADARRGLKIHKAALEKGQHVAEVLNKRKDGEVFPTLLSASVLRDAAGDVMGVMGVSRDITEQKQAEEALRFTQFAIDHTGESAFWMDSEGRFTYVNAAACTELGYTKQELLSMTVFDISPYLAKEEWGNMWAELRERRSVRREVVHRTKDGREIAVEVTANHVTFSGQEFNCSFARDITDRKKAQEALKRSEENYRGLFNSTTDAIFIHDRQGRFIDVNPAVSEMYGYSREELIGNTPIMLTDTEKTDPASAKGLIDAAFAGEVQHFEWWGKRKDGESFLKDVLLMKTTYNGEEAVIASARDITEKRRAEEAIRESEERYRKVVENATDIIFQHDINGSFTFLNPVATRRTEYSAEELIGMSYATLVHPDDVDRIKEFFEKQFRERAKEGEYECRIVTKKGKVVWIRASVTSIMEGERIVGWQSIGRDITERKQAQEALKESEKKYRNLVDNAVVGVFSTNLEGEVLYVNEAALRMLEFGSPEELITSGALTRYKNPHDRRVFLENLKTRGEVNNYEIELLTKTGKTRNVLVSATLDGDILSGIVMDVTERKQAEEAATERLEELERWKKVVVGRELRMIELKKRIKELEKQLAEANERLAPDS